MTAVIAFVKANLGTIISVLVGIGIVPLVLKYVNKMTREWWRKILLPLKPVLWGAGLAISQFFKKILGKYGQHVEDFLQKTVWNILSVIWLDFFCGGMDSDDVKLTDAVNPKKEKALPKPAGEPKDNNHSADRF